MWPWGHAAVGYVSFTVLSVLTRRRPLTTPEAVAVVVGTQVPDLIDKPLGWTVAVLPSGRSLGHSLLTWALVAVVALAVARRVDRERLAAPFVVGYLVGTLTDLPSRVLAGEFSRATFLLWPVLPSPDYDVEPSIAARLGHLTPSDLSRLAVVAVGLVVCHAALSALRRTDATDPPSP